MLRNFGIALGVLSVMLFGVGLVSAGRYSIVVDVGAPPGYSSAYVDGKCLNDSGDVAVNADNQRAFLKSGEEWTDLGVLDAGKNYSAARGINDNGDVVGCSTTASNVRHAFLWTESGHMQDMGSLGGNLKQSWAYGINSSGVVVGYSELNYNYPPIGPHAFRWTSSGGMVDLGTLGGSSRSYQSYAYAVNDSGQIAGYSTGSAVASQGEAFRYSSGTMSPLGTLGGNVSVAYGINADGDVVGYSKTALGGDTGFLYTEAGGMVGLGYLPGGWKYSRAQDVNDDGDVIVGHVRDYTGAYRAAVYTGVPDVDGAWADLNTLIRPDSGWTLTHAYDINGQGQIYGYGTISDQTHAFLLTEALLGDANLDGTVELADLGQLLTFYNQTVTQDVDGWMKGDFDGNGLVDLTDLGSLLTFYNQDVWGGGGGGGLDAAAIQLLSAHGFSVVPEPSTLILLVTGLVGLLAYAWRKRR